MEGFRHFQSLGTESRLFQLQGYSVTLQFLVAITVIAIAPNLAQGGTNGMHRHAGLNLDIGSFGK
jgi:hypothetical protein